MDKVKTIEDTRWNEIVMLQKYHLRKQELSMTLEKFSFSKIKFRTS